MIWTLRRVLAGYGSSYLNEFAVYHYSKGNGAVSCEKPCLFNTLYVVPMTVWPQWLSLPQSILSVSAWAPPLLVCVYLEITGVFSYLLARWPSVFLSVGHRRDEQGWRAEHQYQELAVEWIISLKKEQRINRTISPFFHMFVHAENRLSHPRQQLQLLQIVSARLLLHVER